LCQPLHCNPNIYWHILCARNARRQTISESLEILRARQEREQPPWTDALHVRIAPGHVHVGRGQHLPSVEDSCAGHRRFQQRIRGGVIVEPAFPHQRLDFAEGSA
jgi:hypothetical protein